VAVTASAPGKLVLIGEYAVLFGYPAVVTAVDRRARVELAASSDRCFSVTAPGLAPQPLTFAIGPDGTCSWDGPGRRLPLVDGLLAAMARERLLAEPPAPFAARLDTTSFFLDQGGARHKLGLGSSAALSVALASALLRWSGAETPALPLRWLSTLVELHRSIQGGRGSGVDVAAAYLGGIVGYRVAGEGGSPQVERLSLPGDVRLVFVWTGRSADTSSFLARLEQSRRGNRVAVEEALAALGALSSAAVDACHADDTAGLVASVRSFWDALARLGRAAGLEILSAEHCRLQDIVGRQGGAYKPSGAGGGDVGIAFAAGDEAACRIAREIAAVGFRVLELGIAPTGLGVRSN
jgi:phosphomevalonate kinase